MVTPPHASVPIGTPEVPALDAADAKLGMPASGWRQTMFIVIFGTETRAGRWFDLGLIGAIVASIGVVVLDSMASVTQRFGTQLTYLEWTFTGIFLLEYLARLICVQRPLRYARSFFGVVDLLALVPTLLQVLVPALAFLIDVRILRLLRLFRMFKLSRYSHEYRSLAAAMVASQRKIAVFVGFVMMVILVMATLMYVVEGPANGFTSIPVSVYWGVSTMTTVGFGDITPKTDLGRLIASVMMLLGWGVLAVPTGIVSASMVSQRMDSTWSNQAAGTLPGGAPTTVACAACLTQGHATDARFCRCCGAALPVVPAGPVVLPAG